MTGARHDASCGKRGRLVASVEGLRVKNRREAVGDPVVARTADGSKNGRNVVIPITDDGYALAAYSR